MKRLILIDSYALAHRAYHALPPLTSPQGVIVNGVYGFLLVLLKVLDELKPDYVIATFDSAQPTFRHEEYHDYKAQRVKAPDNFYEQIKIIKEILTNWGIPVLAQGGYEADDLIAVLTSKFQGPDLEIIILTGDLDTLQLVNERTKVYTLRKGLKDEIIYDLKKIQEKYQLLPEQLPEVKALRGDPSDNIKGLAGIGEKTALKLIQDFHDLENLYKNLEQNTPLAQKLSPKLRTTLLQNKEQAFFNRRLVTLDQKIDLEVKLEDATLKPPSSEKLLPLFQQLGFNSLSQRLFATSLSKKTSPALKVERVTTKAAWDNLAKLIQEHQKIGIYFNYEGKKFGERQKKKVFFVFPEQLIFEIPLEELTNLSNLSWEEQKSWVTLGAKVLIEEFPCCRHLKFEDLEILGWLLDPERKNYELATLNKIFFRELKLETLAENVGQLLNLADVIETKIASLDLEEVWTKIEQPLIPILAQMEMTGILVDPVQLTSLTQEIQQKLLNLETQIYNLAGQHFNLNSYQQLRTILFEVLQLDSGALKKTSGGQPSTDEAELEKIKGEHPIIPLIIEYRQLKKMQTSFLLTLPNFINPQTQRIHTIWNQTGTATGRLSSEEPNLQNIPLKGEWGQKIRSAFQAAPGFVFLSLDYSQIDLRLAAHLSLDPNLKEAFNQGKDIHNLTASYLFKVPEEQVTPEMRRIAKVINFGIIYGMGEKALSETAQISSKEAKYFKEQYFKNFPGLKNYLDYSLTKAKDLGYVATQFGRKRFLPLIGSLGQIGRQEERIAVNLPIQGLAADIIKLAMIQINDYLVKEKLTEAARLVLQIHDELILEIKSEIIPKIASQLQEIMETVVKLEVPLKVHLKQGSNWGEL